MRRTQCDVCIALPGACVGRHIPPHEAVAYITAAHRKLLDPFIPDDLRPFIGWLFGAMVPTRGKPHHEGWLQ